MKPPERHIAIDASSTEALLWSGHTAVLHVCREEATTSAANVSAMPVRQKPETPRCFHPAASREGSTCVRAAGCALRAYSGRRRSDRRGMGHHGSRRRCESRLRGGSDGYGGALPRTASRTGLRSETGDAGGLLCSHRPLLPRRAAGFRCPCLPGSQPWGQT